MQTEITSAQKDKMVDLDVSGEGAEIELEDKSHGSVKPETYENVKTEEKDPLQPKVEVQEEEQQQSEEMDQYSDKVKKRIDKMTWKLREAEREKEAALQYAQNVQKELSDAKQKTYDIDKGYMSESEVRNKMAADLARQNLITARESGDYQKEEEARAALTKLDLEAERIRVTKSKKEREYEEFQKQLQQEAQQPQQQARPQPSSKALAWAEKNTWFRQDEEMTDYAQRIHRGLVAEGFDTESDEYYDELTNRVKNKFPESFNQGSDQTTRSNKIAQPVASASRSATSGRKSVKLTPSQVKIANKLGVPLAEYAKYV
jgi:hypothetical protein